MAALQRGGGAEALVLYQHRFCPHHNRRVLNQIRKTTAIIVMLFFVDAFCDSFDIKSTNRPTFVCHYLLLDDKRHVIVYFVRFFILQKTASECDRKRICQLFVHPRVFGKDPCPGTTKYLTVVYKCRLSKLNKTVCEEILVGKIRIEVMHVFLACLFLLGI